MHDECGVIPMTLQPIYLLLILIHFPPIFYTHTENNKQPEQETQPLHLFLAQPLSNHRSLHLNIYNMPHHHRHTATAAAPAVPATSTKKMTAAAAAILLLNLLPAVQGFLPLALPHTHTCTTSTTTSSASFGKRMQVLVAAASKKGGGLRGDVRRGGGSPRPANDSSSSFSSSSFDPKNPFFTSEFGEEEEEKEVQHIEDLIKDAHKQAQTQAAQQGTATNENETEEEREKRLAEEEEFMNNLSKDDPDGYTETFSSPQDRAQRAKETKDRYDFTCLTVEEVARSYQVPISWIGDALCNFGVVPPIQWTARIGDLIDGEQAYAILEAMHGWDHAIMYDMYTWDSLRELAASHELEIADVLQVCDEEGFALPFGLRSHLRVEQYARLMRRLGLAQELTDHIKEQCPDPDYPSV